MGNDNCSDCKQTRVESPAYGEHELLQVDHTVYAVVEKLVQVEPNIKSPSQGGSLSRFLKNKDKQKNSQNQYHRLKKIVIQQLQLRKSIKSPYIVNLHDYRINDQKFGFKVTMQYEYIGKTLSDRIAQLHQKSIQFPQRELFTLLYSIQSSLMTLSSLNIKHCFVHPKTIVHKPHSYKLTDVTSTAYVTSYDLAIRGDRTQFLSERLLASMASKALCPDYEIRDDLFSLGLILLGCATGCWGLYRWERAPSLDYDGIQRAFASMEKNYSSKLVKKVKALVYQSQIQGGYEDQSTNLTDHLISLDEQYTRVMHRAKNACEKSKSHFETTAGTPERAIHSKTRSYSISTNVDINN